MKLYPRHSGEVFQGGDGNPVHVILVSTYPDAAATHCAIVWVTRNDKPRCVGCQGVTVAMSASCKHAQTVRHALARGTLVLP